MSIFCTDWTSRAIESDWEKERRTVRRYWQAWTIAINNKMRMRRMRSTIAFARIRTTFYRPTSIEMYEFYLEIYFQIFTFYLRSGLLHPMWTNRWLYARPIIFSVLIFSCSTHLSLSLCLDHSFILAVVDKSQKYTLKLNNWNFKLFLFFFALILSFSSLHYQFTL